MVLRNEVTPIVAIAYTSLTALEGISESISSILKMVGHTIWYSSLPTMLIGLFTDWDDQLNRKLRSAMKPIDDFAETVHALRKGIAAMHAYLPNLVSAYAPFIENAVFKNSRYADVMTYNGAAAGSLEEMELLFTDIVRQLSSQEAKAINALESQSKKILRNISLLRKDVQRGA